MPFWLDEYFAPDTEFGGEFPHTHQQRCQRANRKCPVLQIREYGDSALNWRAAIRRALHSVFGVRVS